jgi:cytochrome c553
MKDMPMRSLFVQWRRLNPNRSKRGSFKGRRYRASFTTVMVTVLSLCCLLGWGLALTRPSQAATPTDAKPTDVTPQNLQLAEETYLSRCATCHIALPPAVLATEVWKDIIVDTAHYNAPTWTPLRNPDLALTWRYLSTGSRPLNPGEQKIYRVARSRYFKVLHPRVQFKEPATLGTCVSCHPNATQFNYRDITPEWQNSP